MTISGKSFLNLQTQKDKLEEKTTSNELSSGTQSNPQPIQIKSSAAQTISDATKKNINPAIIQMNSNPTPGAVMTAGTPTTKEEDQKAMTEALLQQKKKVDAETKGINADHTNPYSLAHYVQSASELLFGAKTAYTTWGTKSIADVEASAERELELDYNAAKTKIQENRTKEANKKFSDIFAGNTPKTDIQLSANFGPRFGIQNGIGSLNWLGNYQNKWITNDGSEVMMSNGKTTISNPIIHTPDYQGDLAKAYDTVTYAAAQDGVVVTPEYLKENFPGFRDQPDEVVQNFIEDCMYDVQVGEKRPLEMYSNYYQGLAKSDNYVNKQDSILDAITNEDIIDSSLGYFMAGSIEMDGRTAEEWQEYVNAAYTIKARANAINNEGFNETGAGDYILVKTFADQIPELKQAVDTYDKFDIKTVELLKLQNQYNATIQDAKDFMSKVDWSTQTEYNQMIRRYAHDYLDQFNRDFMNNWNTERLQGKLWTAGEGWFDSWLYGKYYEKNGKWYDKDGNEISPEEAQEQKAFINDYLEGIMQISRQADELGFDLQRASESYGPKSTEMYADAIFDSVNLAFNAAMSFTGMGVKFQAMTHLPYIGTVVEGIFNFLMEDVFGNIAMGIADMTQFANGWEKESIEKYKQAVEGLGIMVIGSAKAKLLGKAKARISDKALVKAWKAATQKFVDKLIKLDVEPAKLQELIRESNALPEETGKKPTTRKEVEKQKKAEQKAKTEGKEVEGEKVEGEKVEGEKTEGTKKPMFTTNVFKEAMSEFNRVFEEEYIKENAEGKGSIIDDLFEKARNLYTALTQERSNEINTRLAELEKKAAETGKEMETKALETPTEETVTLEEKTTEGEQQQTVQTEVSETIETAPETPGVRVEETKVGAPEGVEGKIETKESKAVEETKTTINKILDFMQDLQNTSKEIYNKINEGYKKLRAKDEAKIIREREIKMQKDEQLLREAGLTNEQIDLVMNNPFSESILRVIDAMTNEITNKKGKITKVEQEMSLKPDDIQREVLSEGVKAIQEYVDKLVEMKNKLGKLYDELSTKKDIDTKGFAMSEALKNVLDGFDLEISEEIGEDLQITTKVTRKGGGDMTAKQEAIAKYVETMIDKHIRRRMISEQDAQAIRTKFDWSDDTTANIEKAAKNSFRDAFNKYIDGLESTELLRKIDEGYNKLSDGITDLKEILDKKNDVKDNAKNKILKWDEETLDQMESIIPGIKDLVELAKQSPDIVNKGVKAKMKTKETRRRIADPIRYSFVGLPAAIGAMIGGRPLGILGTLMGSFVFKWSENIGGALKRKIVKKAPDLEAYNAFVDNLSIDPKVKDGYKQQALNAIEEIRKQLVGERESSFNALMTEVNKIIIDRKARDILDEKGTEPTKPTTPKQPTEGGATEEPTLTPKEQKIVEASLGKEEGETYSPKAEKIADELEKLEKLVDDVTTDYATEKLEEKGEDVTPENIQKVKESPKEEPSIEEFIAEMNKGSEHTVDPTKPDYRKTDLNTLTEILKNPEKYPDVDIEAVKEAVDYILAKNQEAELLQSEDWYRGDMAFTSEVRKIEEMEQKVADTKNPETKQKLKRQHETEKEKLIERIGEFFGLDQFEAADKYDELASKGRSDVEKGDQVRKGIQGNHRIVKAEQDKLLALMGKGPSQNIKWTSTADNIQNLSNPKTRKKVAQERLDRRKKLSEEETKLLNEIIEKADVEIKAQEELLAQKKELAEKNKQLKEKRSRTRSREERQQLTKEITKTEEEFEKLSGEDFEKLYSKPEDVVEAEAKDAVELAGKEHLIDSKQYNPRKVNVAEREIKHENPKEKDIWTDSNGEEVTFYHGTPNGGFEAFSMDFRGKSNDRNGPGDYGRGMYFTPYKDTAMGYTKHSKAKSENPEIYETKLRMENPLRLDLYHQFQKAMWKLMREDTNRGYSLLSKEHGENVNKLMEEFGLTEELYDRYEDMISSLGDNRWDMDIRNHGYDGIISEDGKEVIIPDPDQIIIQKHYSTRERTPEQEKEQLKKINKEIENSLSKKGGTDVRANMTDREKIDFTDSLEPHEEFYHASDTDIKEGEFDLSKTKDDPNGIGLAVSLEKTNTYGDKPNQYTISGKDMNIAKEGTTTSEDNILMISEILQIEPSPAWSYIPLAELSSIIRGEVESKYGKANNADIIRAFNQVTGYDGVITSHGYGLLWNIDKINANAKKNKTTKTEEAPKKEATAPKEEIKTPEKGSEPLIKVEANGKIEKEPMVGDLKTQDIYDRMQYIRAKAKEAGKIFAREANELRALQELYKRQVEFEAREEQGDITDDDYVKAYETGGGGINHAPF